MTFTNEQLAIKVSVEYPDGKGNHETTLRELRSKFQDEASGWQAKFFADLLNLGIAHSRFGEYKKLS